MLYLATKMILIIIMNIRMNYTCYINGLITLASSKWRVKHWHPPSGELIKLLVMGLDLTGGMAWHDGYLTDFINGINLV